MFFLLIEVYRIQSVLLDPGIARVERLQVTSVGSELLVASEEDGQYRPDHA